jgi:thiol-disulfide isomerase/thioredoxin
MSSSSSSSSTITNVDKNSIDKLKSKIKKEGATIILYHWNSCGHCHRFMPDWNQLKSMYGNLYNFYDIEYSKMQEAPSTFGNIHSFPTIRMYLTNRKINYDGNRDISTLSNFIKSNVPPKKSLSQKSQKTPTLKTKTKKQ